MTRSPRCRISRRGFLLGSAASITAIAMRGTANISRATAVATVTLDLHLTYGQSWGAITFDSFASPFGINPHSELLLTCRLPPLHQNTGPRPCPNSLGINIPGVPDGLTGYASTDGLSVGRIGVITQQDFRVRDGIKNHNPIMELCFCYPGSSWTSGGGGGLAPGAMEFEGSISGTTLIVTSPPRSGVISPGQNLSGAGVHPATKIQSFGTGRGGTGTYGLGINSSSLSTTFTGTGPSATFTASINRGLMTATDVASGNLSVGQAISGSGLPAGTQIATPATGRGDTGSYLLTLPQTVSSETMSALGVSWTNQGIIMPQVVAGLSTGPRSAIDFRSVHYIQAGSADRTLASKLSDLSQMLTDYDALKIPKSGPLRFYLSQAAPISTATSSGLGDIGTYQFCRNNAPGIDGPWSGRCFASTPWYQWQFRGSDDIHTGDYGSARHGEFQGYVRWLVQDKGIAWTPLWRSLTLPITVSGQVITIPFDRPAGPDFASKVMGWQSEPSDGIKVWPGCGFYVKRGGSFLTLSDNPVISGMTVRVSVAETLSPGDVLEVSNAMYGPGGTNPGASSGIGSNLAMKGPHSALFANKSIDAWSWPFLENVTV